MRLDRAGGAAGIPPLIGPIGAHLISPLRKLSGYHHPLRCTRLMPATCGLSNRHKNDDGPAEDLRQTARRPSMVELYRSPQIRRT